MGGNWVGMTVDCEWAIAIGGGGLGTEQLDFSVIRLAVVLLQLSHCSL